MTIHVVVRPRYETTSQFADVRTLDGKHEGYRSASDSPRRAVLWTTHGVTDDGNGTGTQRDVVNPGGLLD
jgi:hypothetical protein